MENEASTFEATLTELPKMLSWVRAQVEPVALNSSEKKRVELALEEAIVNIIHHASKENILDLTLSCRHEPHRQIEFEVSDRGPPFNPLLHPESPSHETPVEEREIGGLGLTFMRKCMDALFYRREDNQNILTLVKNTEQEEL